MALFTGFCHKPVEILLPYSAFWKDLTFSGDEHQYSAPQQALFCGYRKCHSFTARITNVLSCPKWQRHRCLLSATLLWLFGSQELTVMGSWRPSTHACTPLYTAQKHRRSSPIMASASPGPSAQASGRCLCLHHLFSVTCLQLNCGGCYISPP